MVASTLFPLFLVATKVTRRTRELPGGQTQVAQGCFAIQPFSLPEIAIAVAWVDFHLQSCKLLSYLHFGDSTRRGECDTTKSRKILAINSFGEVQWMFRYELFQWHVFRMQPDILAKLRKCASQSELVSSSAFLLCIATCTPPDPAQLLACKVNACPYGQTCKAVNKQITVCHDTANEGLIFVPMDVPITFNAHFADASFGISEGFRSQI